MSTEKSSLSCDDLEDLRRRFKPEKIRFLFVGESPPRKCFFYDPEKEGNLSRHTRKAFEESIKVMYPNKHSFLEDFKRRRCYLADLFNERGKKVKKLSLEERQYAVNKLSNLIRKEKPKVVIGVLKRVESLVKEAVCSSSEKLKFEALCFPIGKYIKSYKESLKRILLEEK